jgi:DNA-binding NtrC family response regulator
MISKKTVLVIDDEEPYREFLHNALEDQGYRVIVAASAKQGLKAMTCGDRNSSPICVTMDRKSRSSQ